MTDTSRHDMIPTIHTFRTADARHLDFIEDNCIDLVVTSPPYPMISMWDRLFREMNPGIGQALDEGDGQTAFTLMHEELNKAWAELARIVRPGGFICINIGDAVRTVAGTFRLYPNHIKIEDFFMRHGLDILPRIIWRKTTNAPTKFMGSGVLPAGAYVTLEHEYILIFRQAGKRLFTSETDKARRRRSALFWEERNSWYADLWDVGGARQEMNHTAFTGPPPPAGNTPSRRRSAAFPFDVAYRLVGMYSLQGDRVLDPFLGTGTTVCAAAALGRNSLGIDIDDSFIAHARREFQSLAVPLARYNQKRLEQHRRFTESHTVSGNTCLHVNPYYDFPVKTRQERELYIPVPGRIISMGEYEFRMEYGNEK
jgi:DNA modification methylase